MARPSPDVLLRDAGGKLERRKRGAFQLRRGMFINTHAFADHFLSSVEEDTRTRRRERRLGQPLELSHQWPQRRPPSKQGSKDPTSKLPPTSTQSSAQVRTAKLRGSAEKELTRSGPCSRAARNPVASPLHVHENGPQESNQQRIQLRLDAQNAFQIPPVALKIGTSERRANALQRVEFFPSLSLG